VLTLPAAHTRSDLEQARILARRLNSGEMHVFWLPPRTQAPQANPGVLDLVITVLERVHSFTRRHAR